MCNFVMYALHYEQPSAVELKALLSDAFFLLGSDPANVQIHDKEMSLDTTDEK